MVSATANAATAAYDHYSSFMHPKRGFLLCPDAKVHLSSLVIFRHELCMYHIYVNFSERLSSLPYMPQCAKTVSRGYKQVTISQQQPSPPFTSAQIPFVAEPRPRDPNLEACTTSLEILTSYPHNSGLLQFICKLLCTTTNGFETHLGVEEG